MKNLLSRKWLQNLTNEQKDLLLGLFIILIVAIIYYFQWAFYLTGLHDSKVNIDQPARYFWWANDSRSYRDVGEWLFGRSDITLDCTTPVAVPTPAGVGPYAFCRQSGERSMGQPVPDVAGKRTFDLPGSAKRRHAPPSLPCSERACSFHTPPR